MGRINQFRTSLSQNENKQEELIINLKKELVLLKIKQKTKQNFKPHLAKEIKSKISKIRTLDRIIK